MYQYQAKITGVTRGGTVIADIDLGFDVWLRNQHLTLYGVNVPEMAGLTRTMAIESARSLNEACLGKDVIIETHRDKIAQRGAPYQVIIMVGKKNINELLNKQEL